MRLRAFVGLFILAAGAPTAASAQAWIGLMVANMANNDRNACLRGARGPWSEHEVAEARLPAQARLADYWARAAAADPADVTAVYFRSGRLEWVANGVVRNRGDLARISDPMARDPDLAPAPAPLMFERGLWAGGTTRARGVWEVRSRQTPSRVAGYYLVDFRNGLGEGWQITRIELLPGAGMPPKVTAFCERPGDIDVAAAERAARDARRDARRAERERGAPSR